MVYSQTRYISINGLIHEKYSQTVAEYLDMWSALVIFGYHLPGVFRQHAP